MWGWKQITFARWATPLNETADTIKRIVLLRFGILQASFEIWYTHSDPSFYNKILQVDLLARVGVLDVAVIVQKQVNTSARHEFKVKTLLQEGDNPQMKKILPLVNKMVKIRIIFISRCMNGMNSPANGQVAQTYAPWMFAQTFDKIFFGRQPLQVVEINQSCRNCLRPIIVDWRLQFSLTCISLMMAGEVFWLVRSSWKLQIYIWCTLGNSKLRCEDNIKTELREMGWIGFMWIRIGTGDGLLWTWQWTFLFHERRRISWLAELLKVCALWS